MLGRKSPRLSGELPEELNGLPVFRVAEPFVLSNDHEISRLQNETDGNFVRVCKFGIYGVASSHKWFKDIREIIDHAEAEYTELEQDCGLALPRHTWGLVPKTETIANKIKHGFAGRREAFFDRRLLPKGYLLGCEVERIAISKEFDRDLLEEAPGYASPSEYTALKESMSSHIGAHIDNGSPFTHADLSPEQCAIGTSPTITDVSTILFDIEPVLIPSKFYPKAKATN
jgi:hypothetical protein